MTVHRQHIGLGPMGTAVFYAAHNAGGEAFGQLFEKGAALIERSASAVGSGQFHDLAIDTLSDPADSIRFMPTGWPFGSTDEAVAARRRIEALSGQEFCRFPDLAAYYHATGRELIRYAADQNNGSRFIEANVDHIICDPTERAFCSFDTRGNLIIRSNELVLATGGVERIHADLQPFGDRVFRSRDLLVHDKTAVKAALARAEASGQKTIVILGSGTSAIGALGELSQLEEARGFEIVMAYRSKFYIHYPSLQAAREAGYTPPLEEVSNQEPYPVNRIRGLRTAGRAMLEAAESGALGRVSFVRFDGNLQGLEVLKNARLIVQAFGYQSAMPRLVDTQGKPIPLQTEAGRIVVDAQDQIVTSSGAPLERAYRVGLGTLKAVGWQVPGFVVEAALTKGPIDGVKAFQGPGGSGEQLLAQLLGRS